MPLGFAKFTLLNTFRAETPSVKLYRRSLALGMPPMGPPPNNGPWPCPPPPPARPPSRAPPLGAALFCALGPNPKVLVSRRFNVKCAGPVPSLTGRALSGIDARSGLASNVPRGVQYTFEDGGDGTRVEQVAAVRNPGRSLNTESPFPSLGEVMLKGEPELATMNGLRRNA